MLLLSLSGIVWVNFHSELWTNFDQYSDMNYARTVFLEKSIFPEDWVFGNQYYVTATPVLAAVFYSVFRDIFLAMGAASCVMTALVLVSFVWCVRPAAKRSSLLAGCLALVAGVFGSNAATDGMGMQILYTIASYYACYLIGILLSLGVWLRLRTGKRCSPIIVAISMVCSFTLGMQSLRQMLVLCLPLLMLDLLMAAYCLWRRQMKLSAVLHSRSLLYSAALLAANAAGVVCMRMLHVPQLSFLSETRMSLKASLCNALLELSHLVLRDAQYPVLVRAACVFMIACVILAAGMIVKKRDNGYLAWGILFSSLSLAAVVFAGIAVIQVRSIYYFVWFLLAALSVVYLEMNLRIRQADAGALMLCAVALVSLAYNYAPVVSRTLNSDHTAGEAGGVLGGSGHRYRLCG